MTSGKFMIINLMIRLTKEISLYKISYFPEPYALTKTK